MTATSFVCPLLVPFGVDDELTHHLHYELMCHWQFGGSAVLGSFGRVVLDVSEDARTRGFPSPSLDGFSFFVVSH